MYVTLGSFTVVQSYFKNSALQWMLSNYDLILKFAAFSPCLNKLQVTATETEISTHRERRNKQKRGKCYKIKF